MNGHHILQITAFMWDILQDLVYVGRRLPFANLQDLKEAMVGGHGQFENPLHNGTTTQ